MQQVRQEAKATQKESDWPAALVMMILQQVTGLWETGNEKAHGGSESEQNEHVLICQKHTIAKLIALKAVQKALMDEARASKLANWIATRIQAVKTSIQHAFKQDIHHTDPITK